MPTSNIQFQGLHFAISFVERAATFQSIPLTFQSFVT